MICSTELMEEDVKYDTIVAQGGYEQHGNHDYNTTHWIYSWACVRSDAGSPTYPPVRRYLHLHIQAEPLKRFRWLSLEKIFINSVHCYQVSSQMYQQLMRLTHQPIH
jgi:hypothetical protein